MSLHKSTNDHSTIESNAAVAPSYVEGKPLKISADEEKGSVEAEFDWDTDRINPLNWPLWKRSYHAVLPAVFGFVVTFASSVYTPAVSDIQKSFNVSQTVALLPFSLFLIGLGFGPVLAAPLSERYGRIATYWISLPLFSLFILGAGFSSTFAGLTICRFFAGVFGSPPLVVGAGTNADLWLPQSRATMTTLFALCPYLGPALGPVIGGYTVVSKGWRWTQWVVLFFAVASYIASLGMQETYKKTILARRAKKLGASPPPGPPPLAFLKFIFNVTFIQPLHMLYSEPIVIAWSVYIGFSFAVVYSFFAAFPYVYTSVYGFNVQENGLAFLSIAVGSIIGSVHVILVDRLQYRKHFLAWQSQAKTGKCPPEHRLYAAMAGSLGLPIGLFMFAWTATKGTHWIVSMIASVFTAWGNMCIFMSGLLYLLDVYEALMGASAVAATTLLRYLLAAGFPLFIQKMYSNLGVGWAASVFGFISIALVPIPWVLYKWGPQLRASSKIAVNG